MGPFVAGELTRDIGRLRDGYVRPCLAVIVGIADGGLVASAFAGDIADRADPPFAAD